MIRDWICFGWRWLLTLYSRWRPTAGTGGRTETDLNLGGERRCFIGFRYRQTSAPTRWFSRSKPFDSSVDYFNWLLARTFTSVSLLHHHPPLIPNFQIIHPPPSPTQTPRRSARPAARRSYPTSPPPGPWPTSSGRPSAPARCSRCSSIPWAASSSPTTATASSARSTSATPRPRA